MSDMSSPLEKTYSPAHSERRWYAQWQQDGIYHSAPSALEPYSVLMPPPNVTGILHFGHVLNNTIQDIYIRWARLNGKESCWFPGLDHAGIATQTKVEKELKSEGLTRYDLGREAFVDRVWEWKNTYGGIILDQLRTLGASADWDRTLFTMDESASTAVKEVFIKLFDEGLIYRGKRVINWSPVAQSALSDEEVIFREVREYIYTLRYHLADGSGTLLVATVRPETIFADVAVAVNPNDERYKHLIGSHVIVPLTDRTVPIIADDYADPEFGTGCVKITPAHDPNDFEIGLRHNLEMPQCIMADATLGELAGEFAGLDRFVARKKIVARLEETELLERKEDYTHNVGFSERGEEPVEPYLSDQWFVRMEPLAKPAMEAVRNGDIRFYPNHWVRTYEHWMTNVRDWCISRQLWWGHRIPVYFAEDGQYTAAQNEAEARTKLGLSADASLRQDPDVLDTWFSSWLWPMTTMGWKGPITHEKSPSENVNALMGYYLPTNLLVTGPDIIFFWVARMIMATLKFNGKVPFRDVYFTSIIRDAKGRKLSKSLGNSPDPLGIIDSYGADAVRFAMIYLAPLGTDVRLDINDKTQDIPSMELGRNFANKVWNACRFLQMKQREVAESEQGGEHSDYALSTADHWIQSRYMSTVKAASTALADYRITEYAKLLYDFIWRDFCDWYVEVVKVQLQHASHHSHKVAVLNHAFEIINGTLHLLHPVMPFLTEELWHGLFGHPENSSISKSTAPIADASSIDSVTEERFETLQLVVEALRRQRAEMGIPPGERLDVHLNVRAADLEFFHSQSSIISTFARCADLRIGEAVTKPDGSVADIVRGIEIYLVVAGKIDFDKERMRLTKEIERLSGALAGVEKKLSNPNFVANAKPEVIDVERQKQADWTDTLAKLERNLASM
ncbi:MAG: valine--tRNA ligase [Candidatus Kapabacteria bacterium]|nr:valine--tRNA ligase [Candidatus Kapabacteria bacterium]